MNKIIKLAGKNLTRQKRRNAILAIAIAFGFFVVTAIDGLTSGMVSNLENSITQVAGGTVLIGGYEKYPPLEEGKKSQLVNIVRDKDYIRNLVEQNDINYRYFSQYTLAMGRIIFNGKKTMTRVYGRDFSEKELVDSFQIVDGDLESLNQKDAIVISKTMADDLNIAVGDSLLFTGMDNYGQNNVMDFTVALIIKASSFVDSSQCFANIETVNEFVGIPEGGYSTFTIFLKNKNEQAKVANKLEQLIKADGYEVSSRALAYKTNPKTPDNGITKQFVSDDYQWEGTKYGVETLNDAIPALKTVMSVVHTISTVILLVILLIVMVGVSNTYRMVLYERIREIGTMRALGMTGKDTGKVFTYEAVLLCLIGACAGLLLSVIVMFIVHLIPVNVESLSFFLHKGHFTFVISPLSLLLQYILLIVLTTLAVHGSAKKASSMAPAQALRTVK